jgi:hypothetical protein
MNNLGNAQQCILILPKTTIKRVPANRGMHILPTHRYVPRINSKGLGFTIQVPGKPGSIQENPFMSEENFKCPFCNHPNTFPCMASKGALVCTRPEGHVGDHVACGKLFHSMEIWDVPSRKIEN